jgi:hypothetical protein
MTDELELKFRVKPKVVEQTAAEKRRAAIMAALEPNTINPSGPSKPAVIAKPKPINMTSMMVGGQRVAVARKDNREAEAKVLVVSDSEDEEIRELPSILKDLPSRKRQLPWEENVG